MMQDPQHQRAARRRAVTLIGTVVLAVACADVSTNPETPASIELQPFGSPSVVLGDTLRDESGVVSPVIAAVRNGDGDVIQNADVRYLYAEFNRDSALVVDSLTGVIVGRKVPTAIARIAARVGGQLQVLRPLIVTVRPDSVVASTSRPTLTTSFPDTGRVKANANTTTEGLGVVVTNRQGAAAVGVNGWLVRFSLVKPANASNDTTAAVFLVNDNGSASVLDTTDANGNAGRKVRIRAAQFPTVGTDTVEVRATVTYKGKAVPGSGALVRAVITRGRP